MRRTNPICADIIDGVKDDIPGHFKSIYSEQHNCMDDGHEVSKISKEIEEKLMVNCLDDVKKVTGSEVKKATANLKPGKGDPTFSFSSYCIKVDSGVLAEYTVEMI